MTRILHHLSQSKFIRLVAKGGLTALALWLVLSKVNGRELAAALKHQYLPLIALVLVIQITQMLLCAVRWHVILATLDGRAPMLKRTSIRIYTIAAFFNVCLPGTIGGDVVRVFLCRPKVALPVAIHSVIIDRLAALAGLLVLVAATLPWLATALHFPLALAAMIFAVLVLLTLALLFGMDSWAGRFREMHIIRALLYFAANVRLLLSHGGGAFVSAVISVVTQFTMCLCVWLLALSLGAAPTLLECVTLVPPVILASMLPISIGGWGVREAGMVGMLALAGVPDEIALIVSIQLGLAVTLAALPGGWLWLKKPASISMPSMTRGPGRTK